MEAHINLLKAEFRDFCACHVRLQHISDAFSVADFAQAACAAPPGETRRDRVERFYAAADWTTLSSIREFAKVIEQVLLFSFVGEDAKATLRCHCTTAGLEVDRNGHSIHLTRGGVGQRVKNLIFASNGPKPDILLADAVSNDIQIFRNAESCLVYDDPIYARGLLWRDLVEWWSARIGEASTHAAAKSLRTRLEECLASDAERLVWRTYYKGFYPRYRDQLPAVVPQVYLHYDPYCTFPELCP
jgi:hypothetical protein